ncbi:MAG: nitroreductase [Roseibacillus sp.]|nr:nitroreductase [Roseibacillus sp.]
MEEGATACGLVAGRVRGRESSGQEWSCPMVLAEMSFSRERPMNPVQENLISRRSIFVFKDHPVERAVLERAFEAARHAPCHKNTHPWKFYVMGEATRLRILPGVEQIVLEKNREATRTTLDKARQKILAPPELVAVTSRKSDGDPFREEEDYAATVCALHNLVLSLWENGVGSQWTTGAITRDPLVYDALGISEDAERVIGFIRAGYPEEVPPKEKKALEEIRFYLP